jgi:cytochrome c oxidase subunit II
MGAWRDRLAFLVIAFAVGTASFGFAWTSMVDVVQRSAHPDANVAGGPVQWELNFQFPHSPLSAGLFWFHNLLFGINIAICAIVLVLLLFAVWRFRSGRNPVPSRTTHNTLIEVTWTILPVIILVTIAVPSFALVLQANTVPPNAEFTLKVTGHQWYWEYSYPDQGGFQFSSVMLLDDQLPADQKNLRLLLTDEKVVLPVNTVIRIQITSADVIHSWALPSLGIKKDAIPGRLNEAWIMIEREGLFLGQCSVLCGTNHAFMPIAIQAVSKRQFERWLEKSKKRFSATNSTVRTASNDQWS